MGGLSEEDSDVKGDENCDVKGGAEDSDVKGVGENSDGKRGRF